MNKLTNKVKEDLLKFRRAQDALASHYEKTENREMAYLVRWSILERFVKVVATEYRLDLLRNSLNEWLAHIENGKPRPSKNPKFSIEVNTLPEKQEFIKALQYYGFNGTDVWAVMDSRGKHRRHRNELAHTGKKFINMALYYLLYGDLIETSEMIFALIESNKTGEPDGKKSGGLR
jgi:hypothetical protein